MITDIWVNGKRLDMYSNTNIKHTIQVNDIAEVKDRQASFTNSFNIPKTPNNIQLFSGLGIHSDSSRIPYEKPSCQVKIEGFDLIVKGWLNITDTNDDYKIYIYSGIIDFFKTIENKTIGKDLNFSEITPYKGITEITQSWSNENVKYLLADYGGQTHYTSGTETIINADFLVPSIRLKYVWDKIFAVFGYEYSGSIFEEEDFLNLWIPYPTGRIKDFYRDYLFAEGFSDLLISDLVKEVIIFFGLTIIPNEYTDVIEFKTIDERFKTAEIIDWTDKFIERTNESYVYGYAQLNQFKFKYNDSEEQYNDGFLIVENKNISDSKIIFSSKFYTSEKIKNTFNIGTDVFLSPSFKLVDRQEGTDGEITYKALEKRYMFIRAEEKTGTIKLGSATLPIVPLSFTGTFFIGIDADLTLQFFVNKYYNGLYNVLKNSRIHDITLNLSPIDLTQLNLGALYYFAQEQQTYILNKLTYDEQNQKGEFVKAVRYGDYEVIIPISTIKFRDYDETELTGNRTSIHVLDLGISNIGSLTITNQKWVINKKTGSVEVNYAGATYLWSLQMKFTNVIYLRSELSNGSVVYSNTLTYNEITESFCFKGRWETDDPVHPEGGFVRYIDISGTETIHQPIWIENIVTINAIEILETYGVDEVDCGTEI